MWQLSETTLTSSEVSTDSTADGRANLALALVWSRYEPERTGELLLLDSLLQRRSRMFVGRGGTSDESVLSFARVRPAQVDETGPFRSQKISRRQLGVDVDSAGSLLLTSTGRGQLRINGRRTDLGRVELGDTIEVEQRFILLCVEPPVSERLVLDARLRDFPFGEADGFGIVGESRLAWELRSLVQLIAARDGHVLIAGPSGSGKELVAGAVHALSRRATRPLVARNAATIPESLIDAELFGNALNYPNPGMRERSGLIGAADRSTLFLDEIGELPHALQSHLLRVMDRGEYQRLGETTPRVADVRVIAATNRDPAELKHDLVARFPLRVETPGIEARQQDLPLLVRHLLRELRSEGSAAAGRGELGVPELSPALVKHLLHRRFVSNVRELRELLWRSLAEQQSAYLEVPRSRDESRGVREEPAAVERSPERSRVGDPDDPDPVLGLDRATVVAALDRCAWVQERAWRSLGLSSRHQLRRLLVRLDIRRPQTKTDPSTLTRDEVLGALERAGWVKTAAARELGLSSRFQLLRILKGMAIREP